jgi:predicted  nucleic acid-binding Zn-ribbon protein
MYIIPAEEIGRSSHLYTPNFLELHTTTSIYHHHKTKACHLNRQAFYIFGPESHYSVYNHIMSQTLNLYRLQQIDSQIDRANSRLQAIRKILEDSTDLQQAMDENQLSDTAFVSAERNLKQAERDAQNLHIKIEQIESNLYSGTTHNPKELQDLQNDLAALKRHRITLEDQQLDAMINLEKAEATVHAAKSKLQVVRNRLEDQNRVLDQEQEGLLKEIDKLVTERNAATSTIPAESMELYSQLRQQKSGLAIATISDNSCDACGSTLSPAQIQSARSSSQMALCPSCGRILYGS